MFEMAITIHANDYASIINKLLPTAFERLDRSTALGKTLAQFKNMPEKMVKAAVKVLPKDVQDDIVISLFSSYEDKIAQLLNRFAINEQLDLEIKSVRMKKDKEASQMIISANFEVRNYENLAVKVLPLMNEKLEKATETETDAQMLELFKRIPKETYLDFFRNITIDIKDELVILLLAKYEKKIVNLINEYTAGESIQVEIVKVIIRKN